MLKTLINRLLHPKIFLTFVYCIGILILLWLWQTQGIETIRIWLRETGPFAYGVYLGLYVLLSLAFLPVSWLNVTAGILFGPFIGALFIMLGVVLASSVTFLISRRLVNRKWIQDKLSEQSRLIEKMFSKPHSWKTIFILRISNMAPFAAINYLSGAMEIRFASYLLATIAGSIPGALISSGLGALLYSFLISLS